MLGWQGRVKKSVYHDGFVICNLLLRKVEIIHHCSSIHPTPYHPEHHHHHQQQRQQQQQQQQQQDQEPEPTFKNPQKPTKSST